MDMRSEYERTEIGTVPKAWAITPLKGISPRQSVGLVINPSTYFDKAGTVPLLVGSNVEEGRIDATSASRITSASNDLLSASRLAAGDLVTVRVGEPGATAVVPQELDGCNCASMMIIRRHASFDSHWLCAAMNSQIGRRQVQHVQYGTAQKQFNISDAVDFQFAVPPLREQRAIATALNDVDALLSGLDRLIAKKRDLKQAAMQQLLAGQIRLPGYDGEWSVTPLGAIGRCLRGVSYRGDDDLAEHDTPRTKRLLRSNNVQGAVVVTQDVQYVNEDRVAPQQVMRADDILMCTANGSKALVGKAALFAINDGFEYTFGAFMGCFRTDASLANPYFVFSLFQTGQYREYVNNLLAGSSINNLRPSSIESLKFPFPRLGEQDAIAAILSDIDAELSALEARYDKTRALKQAMMQELLTGRTRLI